MLSLRDFELLSVDWILCFEVNFVFEVLGQTQVIIVNAQGILMLAQNVQISVLELIQNLQVAWSLDLISGKSLPLHFWKAFVDILADG